MKAITSHQKTKIIIYDVSYMSMDRGYQLYKKAGAILFGRVAKGEYNSFWFKFQTTDEANKFKNAVNTNTF